MNSDILIREIKARAKLFTEDNFEFPTLRNYTAIESAFLAGAQMGIDYMTHEARLEKNPLLEQLFSGQTDENQ